MELDPETFVAKEKQEEQFVLQNNDKNLLDEEEIKKVKLERIKKLDESEKQLRINNQNSLIQANKNKLETSVFLTIFNREI